MLMVIYGAGASYDSIMPFESTGPLHDYRPPLTNELFNDRARSWIPGIIHSIPHVRSLAQDLDTRDPHHSMELALEQWIEETANPQIRNRSLAALRFYLQVVFKKASEDWLPRAAGKTNYLRLLSQIENWRYPRKERVVLITFNYDILLDEACKNLLMFDPRDLGDYIARDDFKLFKPHGSINWGRIIEDPGLPSTAGKTWAELVEGVVIASSSGLNVSKEYSMNPKCANHFGGNLLLPAIAIPLQKKAEFECPGFHLAELDSVLGGVHGVLVIGWRATETHFLAMCKSRIQPAVPWTIVNGGNEGGCECQNNLQAAGIKGPYDVLDMGFSKFLQGGHVEGFLKSV